MNIDGHFPRWVVDEDEVERMAKAFLTCSSAALHERQRYDGNLRCSGTAGSNRDASGLRHCVT